MRERKFEDFPEDERDDFQRVLARWHQNPRDFEVTGIQSDPPENGAPVDFEVTVRRISTGAVSKFRGGHVSHWVIDFEHALRAKAFG
ncbi:hypothetical protein [Polaromonas jejuensis]|uniref:Uncharacterized protein n=1 Tax=Polaromonas jejuensis TaxID=457502 RepID=A0ABW0QBK6_9BURK|nr:hypothetical protein [Polaromonas jejuensis]